ncbi:hypothetical protein L7F22_063724 [Adiantum nelumboides]|nr:hypothetical protein [Adiantum nelumboides]
MAQLKALARAQGASAKGKKRRKETDAEDAAGRLLEVSITISVGGGDIDVSLLACMNEFLKKETCADICSLERGGVAFNLHFQMYDTSLHVLQMGRTKGPEWDFVQKLNSIGRGMFVCKCKYCPHVYDGGPNRIRAHILGIKGEGVAACLDPPDAIKEICKKLHVAKGKMFSQGTDVNDHVDANIEHVLDGQDAEKVSSQSHMDVDINVGPSMKKAKLSSDKNTLAKAWQMQARKAATVAVRRFFYAEDVPHWKVRSPFFLNMVKAIGKAGPSYVPPSYHLLRTKELVEEVRCINGDLLDVKEKWKKYGCTIVSDGWSDIRKRPIINFMACSIYGTVFLKSVDTSGEEKSGEYIFGLLRQVICEVGPANVVQVCMDNASNCIVVDIDEFCEEDTAPTRFASLASLNERLDNYEDDDDDDDDDMDDNEESHDEDEDDADDNEEEGESQA